MRTEQRAGVLRTRVALDPRLEQVADWRRDRHSEPEQQRVRLREPILVEPSRPRAEDGADHPDEQSLERLVRRDPRRERPGAEPAPTGVRTGVAGECPDEHAGDDPAAMVELT